MGYAESPWLILIQLEGTVGWIRFLREDYKRKMKLIHPALYYVYLCAHYVTNWALRRISYEFVLKKTGKKLQTWISLGEGTEWVTRMIFQVIQSSVFNNILLLRKYWKNKKLALSFNLTKSEYLRKSFLHLCLGRCYCAWNMFLSWTFFYLYF